MPSKSSKSVTKSKSAKSSLNTSSKPATRVVTSKSSKGSSQQSRNKFVAAAVLVAAALIAFMLALPSYRGSKAVPSSSTAAIKATMYTSAPESRNTVRPNSVMTVNLYENSGKHPVNAVQSVIHYPADKLQFVSVKPSPAYPREAATDTATPGLIRLARAVGDNAKAVTGSNVVATLEFNVLPSAKGTVEITVDKDSSLVVGSSDNQNLLDQALTTTYRLE